MSKRTKLPPVRAIGYGRMSAADCPRCQQTLRAATGFSLDASAPIPAPGCLTLCDQCATWLVFTDTMGLRLATREEIRSVPVGVRRLATDLMLRISMKGRKH